MLVKITNHFHCFQQRRHSVASARGYHQSSSCYQICRLVSGKSSATRWKAYRLMGCLTCVCLYPEACSTLYLITDTKIWKPHK